VHCSCSSGAETKKPAVKASSNDLETELTRFIGDCDGILDTIHDPDSLEAAKPRLIARTQTYVEWAARQPKGMRPMNPKVFNAAMARHQRSLLNAYKVPGAQDFWQNELFPEFQKALQSGRGASESQ
jgi:hypothetical protein